MKAFATQPTFTQPASQRVLRFLGSPEQLLVAGQQSSGEFALFQTTGEAGTRPPWSTLLVTISLARRTATSPHGCDGPSRRATNARASRT